MNVAPGNKATTVRTCEAVVPRSRGDGERED